MEHTHIAKDGTVYTHTHEEAHEHGHSHSHPHHHESTKAVLNRKIGRASCRERV